MKRTILLLLVLLLLGVLYFGYLKTEDKSSSIKIKDREFVLKDQSQVAVITIDSRGRPPIHLSKTKDGWYVNNKQRANQRIVQNMLNTMERMAIKYIPTKNENATALKRMEMHGIDLKTYDKSGELITDFTLGTNTNDEYGTYCLNQGAEQSYVMSVPVLEGGIRNFFTQSQEEMRDLNVFAFRPIDIREITVDYNKDIKSSYTIERVGAKYKFTSGGTEQEVNQNVVDAYVSDFKSMTSEYVRNDHVYRDTILSFTPFMEISIKSQNRPDFDMKVFPLIDLKERNVNTRTPGDITKLHQRFFILTSDDDFYMVQDLFFKKFIKKPSYFY